MVSKVALESEKKANCMKFSSFSGSNNFLTMTHVSWINFDRSSERTGKITYLLDVIIRSVVP